jgi:hypothetical protein
MLLHVCAHTAAERNAGGGASGVSADDRLALVLPLAAHRRGRRVLSLLNLSELPQVATSV